MMKLTRFITCLDLTTNLVKSLFAAHFFPFRIYQQWVEGNTWVLLGALVTSLCMKPITNHQVSQQTVINTLLNIPLFEGNDCIVKC